MDVACKILCLLFANFQHVDTAAPGIINKPSSLGEALSQLTYITYEYH